MRRRNSTPTSKGPKHPNVEISVKNFGPIAEASIDLRPLTVFVGPSNTGKTYFSTLIYALHGIFNGFSQLPFGSGNIMALNLFDLLGQQNKNEISAMLKRLNTIDQPFKFADLPQVFRDKLQSAIKDPEILKEELKRCFDLNSITELIRLKDGQREEMTISVEVSDENHKLWNFNLEAFESEPTVDGSIYENVPFQFKKLLTSEKAIDIGEFFIELSIELKRYTEDRAYLPAARSGIMQSHQVIASSLVERATRGGVVPLEVPTFSGVVADFIKQLILYKETASDENGMNHLADALESKVLSGTILMKSSLGGYPEFLYCPSGMKENIRLTRAASMVSELAPIVLFLRGGIRSGVTLIIEEPEAHLHPGAQTDIALTLAGLVRAGVRVVVTTHSDWLLKEIGNLIRIGELKRKRMPQVQTTASTHWLLPEEVGTWWFQKDGVVKHIPFDSTEGIEPKDYEEVAYKLYDRSVNLQDLLEEVEGGSSEWD